MSYTGPYTNFHEINLNLFIRALKKLQGGTGGESLIKKSNVEYDYEWKTLTAQDVGAMPDSYTPPVTSVNGKTGSVVLDAQDVGALPDSYTAPVDSVNGKTGVVLLGAHDIPFLSSNVYNQILSMYPLESVSGSIMYFPDGASNIPVSNISADPGTTSITIAGKNIFDESIADWKVGYFITATGEEGTSTGYKYSQNFTKVIPGESYVIQLNKGSTATVACTIPCYDENYNFVDRLLGFSATSGTGIKYGTFTVPNTCHFIRLNAPANSTTDIQIETGTVKTDYEAYNAQMYETPFENVVTRHGPNNITADGNVSITYRADIQLYIDKKTGGI